MPLAPETRLGPYEIIAPLGAGGMGEVYRARDPRLGREVAVKVLPHSFAADADRLRRFETEARAAARLSHPNILQIYDVGEHDGRPYLVTELLEGETLRDRMAGSALPVRKAIELAIPVAYGLAAAHEQGIVHRDLKPENLFITRDGRVKILDFGLAKLTRPEEDGDARTNAPTMAADTAAGLVLGTVGYMSPEQVRGQATDARSDIFAFGSILYEMVAGTRAFKGDSPADTMSAILREDPPDLTTVDGEIPLVIERIVRHCLEKSPGQRFRSAHDLAFQLEAISGLSSSGAVAAVAGEGVASPKGTSFAKLTYPRGMITSARFAPDGHTVVYAAAWEGNSVQLFIRRRESPDSVTLPISNANILAISPAGDMAVQLDQKGAHNGAWSGTLAIAPMFGGAPREVAEHVEWVDWRSASIDDLVVVRDVSGTGRIEHPLDHVLYETRGHVSYPRLSPDGKLIAFIDHPYRGDDRGTVAVVDRDGKVTHLSSVYTSIQGLAWLPSGEEIWFTAAEAGSGRSVYAVRPTGELRLVSGFPGGVRLFDISKSGALLLVRDDIRLSVMCKAPDETVERDLSWLDWSIGEGLSADGRTLLFDEANAEVGPNYFACIRKTDGSPHVRIGEGAGVAISPDGRWVLTQLPHPGSPLTIIPTGTGRKRTLDSRGLESRWAYWLPDNRHFLWVGRGSDLKTRGYVIDRESDEAVSLSLEHEGMHRGCAVFPDSKHAIVAFSPDSVIVPLDGTAGRPGPIVGDCRRVAGMSRDGEWLWIEVGEVDGALQVDRLHLESGERESWKKIAPADPSGVARIQYVSFSADGEAYAYTLARMLSELYVAEGMR